MPQVVDRTGAAPLDPSTDSLREGGGASLDLGPLFMAESHLRCEPLRRAFCIIRQKYARTYSYECEWESIVSAQGGPHDFRDLSFVN